MKKLKILLIFFTIVSAIGIFLIDDFMVNPNVFIYKWHILASIILSWSLVILTIIDTKQSKKQKYISRFLIILCLPFIMLFLFEKIFFYSLHMLFKNNNKIVKKESIIISKDILTGKYMKGKKCLTLKKEDNILFPIKICGFNTSYKKLKVGDKILLEGNKSIFGFIPKKIYYIK